jgi:hypothetical protein
MTGMRMSFGALAIVSLMACQAAVAAQDMQAMKPGPEHERLGFFVGKWTGTGEMKASPMGPGGKLTSKDDCQWFEGRFAVICQSESTTPMGANKSVGIMSYSPEEKVYTYYGVDRSGMGMTSVPHGTVEGKTWTYTDEMLMGGQKIKSRVLLTELSPTSYSFEMAVQDPQGNWVTVMQSTNTKVQ